MSSFFGRNRAALAWFVATAWLPPGGAHAQPQVAAAVSLQGLMGQRAVLVIDGMPRALSPGQTIGGIKLLRVGDGEATIEVDGRRETLRLGEVQAQLGASRAGGAASGSLVIPVAAGGHFLTEGRINGQAVRFMVDTGASLVAMGAAEAERLGIPYRTGQMGLVSTANGTAPAYRVRLRALRIGDFEFPDTEALVSPQAMPYVLLGNNVLSRFQMTREADRMILIRTH